MILTIWILHGALMFFDEFYFHHRRGLKRWESLGHPLDTLFFLFCFLYVQMVDPANATGFFVLAVVSTLIITKDEFVHAEQCKGGEQWLHALLFILHPVSLFALYQAWIRDYTMLIQIQTVLVTLFGLYQLIYWNAIRQKKNPV